VEVNIRIKRRLFRNPVVKADHLIVADINRTTYNGYRWEALLKNGYDNCPVGAQHAMTLKSLEARLATRLNVEGPWWT